MLLCGEFTLKVYNARMADYKEIYSLTICRTEAFPACFLCGTFTLEVYNTRMECPVCFSCESRPKKGFYNTMECPVYSSYNNAHDFTGMMHE